MISPPSSACRPRATLWLAAGVAGAIAIAACGLNVQAADLFLLTRSGQGRPLTLLVSDGGTIRCDGAGPKALPDPLLIRARVLASDLDKDARATLRIPPGAGSVFSYTIKLQNGSIMFPDRAAQARHELAEAELFAVQAAHGPCGLGG